MALVDYEKLDKEALDKPLRALDSTVTAKYSNRLQRVNDRIEALYDEYEDYNGRVEYSLIVGSLLLRQFQVEVEQITQELETIKNSNINSFFNEVYDKGFNGSKDIISREVSEDISDVIINQQEKVDTISQRLGGATTRDRLARDKSTTSFLAKQRVENAIKDEKTYTQTKKELKGVMESDIEGYMTIAETKGHTIVEESKKNFALGLLIAKDIKMVKVWQTMEDEKVRVSHNNANQQERTLDEKFYVGGENLDRPGDPVGSPGNIINCRCILEYRVK